MSDENKRIRSEVDGSDSDDDFGPMPVSSENGENIEGADTANTGAVSKPKKLRKLEFENLFIENLPASDVYEYSYMHRDIVTHIVVSKPTEFIITGSCDGHIKFWKKMQKDVEFVKHFQVN